MNTLKVGCGFRGVWRVAVLLVVLLAGGVRAAEPQSNRFLLVFETSPAFKKNLPAIRQTLSQLLGSNLQREIKTDDDLAVWTVDKDLHTAAFPLDNWVPDEASDYGERLFKFLEDQSTSRHATLAALQPLLNRVVKDSQHLTVLIFCDTESRLVGTPYDSGVNEIIANASAKTKGPAALFVIVLRAHHGEYLGCSVNRSGGLNFPKFPTPKPEPPKMVNVPAPKPEVVIKTVPSLIIVGTKVDTNIPAAKPVATSPPAPAPVSPPPVNVAATTLATESAPNVVVPPITTPPVAPVATPNLVPATPVPTPAVPPAISPVVQPNPPPAFAPATAAVAPAPSPAPAKSTPPVPVAVAPVAPEPVIPVASTNPPVAVIVPPAANGGLLLPLALAAVALLAAAVIILALVVRARRPHGSLITSSMQADDEERD